MSSLPASDLQPQQTNSPPKTLPRTLIGMTQAFLRLESAGGICVMLSAVMALLIANSPLYPWYDYVLHTLMLNLSLTDTSGVHLVIAGIHKPILLWINDGLMAIFFFLVGLEIKREFVSGELSSRARALLPFIGAAGGMLIPALIYIVINFHTPENLSGWAIPSATDIAFSLAVLSLLGSRIPPALKVLLMSVAVIDDLGAVIIIALFYTSEIYAGPLLVAGLCLAGLAVLNARSSTHMVVYYLFGMILWVALLKSGVHATLAGVFTALFIPMRSARQQFVSPVERLVHGLHPYVAFMILPVFAFANAGVPFAGMGLHSLSDPVTLGILLGLFIGKPIGIFTSVYLAIRSGLCAMPRDCGWVHIFGMAILCGIGFTMSLFIGGLAFDDLAHQASIRLGVLTGSVLSAMVGYGVLRASVRGRN